MKPQKHRQPAASIQALGLVRPAPGSGTVRDQNIWSSSSLRLCSILFITSAIAYGPVRLSLQSIAVPATTLHSLARGQATPIHVVQRAGLYTTIIGSNA
ncbi:hypothetical protein BD310DRAFT_926333 [Dichomitus squalens]|uniref:Uncharacterized protein n=1 Tax=Dichomitus squalens TaxID=114155 RepID=A0A4Q9PW41_9APHY|nr:hypothetical protein BD310DRAFT_926333 [Dichomitus squalens]